MPKNSEAGFKDYYMDVEGDFLIAENHDKFDGEMRVMPIDEAQRDMLNQRVQSTMGKDMALAGGIGVPASGVMAWLPNWGVPLSVSAPLYVTSLVGMLGTGFKSEIHDATVRRRQRKLKSEILKTQPHYSFKDADQSFELPATILSEVVEFESEAGQARQTVGDLVESFGGHFSGMSAIKNEQSSIVTGQVNPRNFLRATISYAGKQTGKVLAAGEEHMVTIDEAQRKLPRYRSTRNLSEGLKQQDDEATTALLVGALGLYGVLRSQVGPYVSGMMADFYVERGTDAIKKDMERFAAPTSEMVSWDELQSARRYIEGALQGQE